MSEVTVSEDYLWALEVMRAPERETTRADHKRARRILQDEEPELFEP